MLLFIYNRYNLFFKEIGVVVPPFMAVLNAFMSVS